MVNLRHHCRCKRVLNGKDFGFDFTALYVQLTARRPQLCVGLLDHKGFSRFFVGNFEHVIDVPVADFRTFKLGALFEIAELLHNIIFYVVARH